MKILFKNPVQEGYTIVEFMVAATIGLFILLGIATIFANAARSRDNVERFAQQNDNGRYAIELLSTDIHNAGYLGEFNPVVMPTPLTTPNPCATDIASLTAALPESIQGYDGTSFKPTCITDVKAGTDMLVIRRLSTCALGDAGCLAAESSAAYFQASGCNVVEELQSVTYTAFFVLDTNLASMKLRQKDCLTPAVVRRIRTNLYFVANNDKPGDGIPTLKRAEIDPSGVTIVPLVSGIDNLQIEYGIDAGIISGAAPNGVPGAYTANPDQFNACAPAQCQLWWRNVVSAKINLIARSITPFPDYVDTKSYTLGRRADGTANTYGPLNDRFRRQLYQSTVRLFNVAGRNSS